MYKKIFVSNRMGLGDVILTTPILKALKQKYPDSRITFVTSPNCLPIVQGLDFIDEVITYEKHVDSVWKVVKKIWRYDLALCIDFKYRSAVMAFLAGIPLRAGLKHKRKLFLTHPVDKPPEWESTYEPLNFSYVLKQSVGIEFDADLTRLYVPEISKTEQIAVDEMLAVQGIKGGSPYIVLAPVTSWPPKDWPEDRYVELVRSLIEEYSYPVVLLGAPSDAEKVVTLDKLDGVVNLMGRTTVMQMVEIIRRANLLVGGCSGPLHIAGAVRTPFVALYGPTSPREWAPKTKGITISHDDRFPCSPCLVEMVGCPEKPCMQAISVQEVFEACRQMLSESSVHRNTKTVR
ncbi:MAG: lipopolysaccharide heptosyltransferase II [Veillonellales bacterium]